jgi:hypothetical protein
MTFLHDRFSFHFLACQSRQKNVAKTSRWLPGVVLLREIAVTSIDLGAERRHVRKALAAAAGSPRAGPDNLPEAANPAGAKRRDLRRWRLVSRSNSSLQEQRPSSQLPASGSMSSLHRQQHRRPVIARISGIPRAFYIYCAAERMFKGPVPVMPAAKAGPLMSGYSDKPNVANAMGRDFVRILLRRRRGDVTGTRLWTTRFGVSPSPPPDGMDPAAYEHVKPLR